MVVRNRSGKKARRQAPWKEGNRKLSGYWADLMRGKRFDELESSRLWGTWLGDNLWLASGSRERVGTNI